MKYHPLSKSLAIFLCAALLLSAASGFLGMLMVSDNGLYTTDPAHYRQEQRQQVALIVAENCLRSYTARILGGCSTASLAHIGANATAWQLSDWYGLEPGCWRYSIADTGGNILEENQLSDPTAVTETFTVCLSCDYPVEVTAGELEAFDATLSPYRDYYCTENGEVYLYYFPSPEYTVTVELMPEAILAYYGIPNPLLELLYGLRHLFIGLFIGGLLLFCALFIYLCLVAGCSCAGGVARPGGLNRLPLDLYGGAAFLGLVAVAYLASRAMSSLSSQSYAIDTGIVVLVATAAFAEALLAVGFLYALAAQFKAKGRYWWKNSVIGRLCKLFDRIIRFLYRGARKLFYLLPLIWQWLFVAAAMVIAPLFFLLLSSAAYGLGEVFFGLLGVMAVLVDITIVLYGAYAFGLLLKGAEAMAAGDLNAKISTRYLFGMFRQCAEELNALSQVAVIAAKKQMQSERMKTELITNVSHDIKTPLTSIINYVDLLEKPHTEEEGTQYLDVLSRQSLRLKKLIDDLMEMSKASSGSMSVNITALDLSESIHQALGEFSDKLEHADLQVVFRQPEQPIAILADGRLTWRVLSNLLSNIVKYALPGTRVYVDIARQPGGVLLSLKNISREELNVSAGELTERFVRGDASRNTEGSGLGLNIAQSLMELQAGRLDLFVDGDLFKVTLTFPTL